MMLTPPRFRALRLVSCALLATAAACGSADIGSGPDGSSGPDAGGGPDASVDLADAGAEPDAPPPVTSEEETFRVLHWNIAGGKENDCKTAGITAAVVAYVRDDDIDFVGLNEVCRAQYASIEAALRKHWGKSPTAKFSTYVGDATGRVVGNAIFSRLDIERVTKDKLGQDQYGTRNLLCAATQRYPHLRFCSTHLTPGDATARKQLARALTRIESWWQDRRDTVIWSGDLNIRPNDQGLDAVYSAAANHPKNNPGNTGSYREVDDADPEHCPGFGERSTPNNTGGPCGKGGKIDFIFARQNRIVDDQYSGDTRNIPRTCTGVCSDHRAVIGQLRVRIRVD